MNKISLSQFKRAVQQSPGCTITLIKYYSKTGNDIPAIFRGERKVIAVRSYGLELALAHPHGEQTFTKLSIRNGKMFSYEPETGILQIYNAGPRPATAKEQALLDEWEAQRSALTSKLADGYTVRSAEFFFFKEHKAKTLMRRRTHRKDPQTGREIIDDPGHPNKVILVYQVKGLAFPDMSTESPHMS